MSSPGDPLEPTVPDPPETRVPDHDPHATQAPDAGPADPGHSPAGPEDQGRFRRVRAHARGGLGEVFVAIDRELPARWRSRRSRTGTPTTPRAGRGSCWRRRSPAAWSTRGSSRSTGWAIRRRPALLRDAVHPGREPRRGDRAVPRGSTRPAATPAVARWSSGSCCAGSSTSATPWPMPTAGGCSTATSSRQRHARPVRRDPGRRLGPGQARWAGPDGRAAGDGPGRRGPSPRPRRAAPRRCPARAVGDAGLHEPRAGRGRARPARAGLRRLQPGGHPLLPSGRPAAVRGPRPLRPPGPGDSNRLRPR